MSSLYQLANSMHFAWIALFGTAMLCLSLFFGGDHDHEVDHGADGGGEHDADHGGDGNMSILSFKVLWMFMVGFGAGGYFGAQAKATVLGASMSGLLAGLIMGALGYVAMNYLYRHQGNSVTKTSSVVGSTAVVDTAILPGQLGEVKCITDGRTEYFSAQSNVGTPIPVASRVKVVDSTGSVLVVEPYNN